MRVLDVDLCAVGGGSGGRTVTTYARQVGASTALVERRERLGGDCLLYGCVPSKALLAAAGVARTVSRAGQFGIEAALTRVNGASVFSHVRKCISTIEPHDSAEHFRAMGSEVLLGHAKFVSRHSLVVGNCEIRARRFIIATGASPSIPPIPGLESVTYYTNESVFDLDEIPRHLIVVGAGPTGAELAQAFRWLSSNVTVVEKDRMLPREDPELVEILRKRLLADGVRVIENASIIHVQDGADGGVAMRINAAGSEEEITGSHLLIATGRTPNAEGMGLEQAGIAYGRKGIHVDRHLRTTNRKVYAIGDVTGDMPLTHMAVHHAKVAIRNALFRIPASVDRRVVPRVTYTMPELAQVGLTEAEARTRHDSIRVLCARYEDNHRAITEQETQGLVKIVTRRSGEILGASIIGPHAGEVIQTWALAMRARARIGTVSGMIAPYPTLGYSNRKVAETFFTPLLKSAATKRLVRLLALLP